MLWSLSTKRMFFTLMPALMLCEVPFYRQVFNGYHRIAVHQDIAVAVSDYKAFISCCFFRKY